MSDTVPFDISIINDSTKGKKSKGIEGFIPSSEDGFDGKFIKELIAFVVVVYIGIKYNIKIFENETYNLIAKLIIMYFGYKVVSGVNVNL